MPPSCARHSLPCLSARRMTMIKEGASIDDLVQRLFAEFEAAVRRSGWRLAMSSAGSGSPSRTSIIRRFMCMPTPLASFWCFPCINNFVRRANLSNLVISRSSQPAVLIHQPPSWRALALISIRTAFWQGGFDVVSGLIDQLESLEFKINCIYLVIHNKYGKSRRVTWRACSRRRPIRSPGRGRR